MGFGSYLLHLLQFAFWNPDNPVWSVIAWGAFVWALFIWGIPRMSKFRLAQRVSDKINRWRFPILIGLILSSIIVAGYSIQSNYGSLQSQNRPILIFNQSSELTVAVDDTTAIMDFHIENIGVNPAYGIYSRVCWAPESSLENLMYYEAPPSVNPLYPNNQIMLPIEIVRHNSDRWYIYYLLRYSDTANKGTEYTDEYWYLLDFNTRDLRMLSPMQKQTFQPFIDTFPAG